MMANNKIDSENNAYEEDYRENGQIHMTANAKINARGGRIIAFVVFGMLLILILLLPLLNRIL